MSLTEVGVVGKTVARFGITRLPGSWSIPKIQHDLTVNMLPKSQVPKSGRIDPSPPSPVVKSLQSVVGPVTKFYYTRSNPCSLGLRFDDWYYNQNNDSDVATALHRMDDIDLQLRNFRGIRASQLAIERMIAPEEERWGDLTDEVRYVKPWVEQVKAENAEADAWDHY